MAGLRSLNRLIPSFLPGRVSAVGAVVVATLLVFSPITGHQFIDLDDPVFITENPHLKGGVTIEMIRWAFTSTSYEGNWIPLTWIAHALIIQLFGPDPAYHHAASLILHTLNALLLFLLLDRMTSSTGRSLVAALLFALHPLRVQSVAWGAELKDLLSTFFMLCTVGSYLYHRWKPTPLSFGALLISHAAGVCSKSMVVTLPLLLLLLDYWPLGRFRTTRVGTLIAGKTPLLLISLAAGVMTLAGHRSIGAIVEGTPLGERLARGVISYLLYLDKIFRPVDLAVFYPFDPTPPSPLSVAFAVAVIALLSAGAVICRTTWPWLVTGWFWYLISLLPVIGIIQIGDHSIADRYTYIPSIGVTVAVVWGVGSMGERWGRVYNRGVALVVTAVLAALTVREVSYWKGSTTLFDRALAVTGQNWLILNNYGQMLLKRGDVDGALECFRQAVEAKPDAVIPLVNYAALLAVRGRMDEACLFVERAYALEPGNPKTLTLMQQLSVCR